MNASPPLIPPEPARETQHLPARNSFIMAVSFARLRAILLFRDTVNLQQIKFLISCEQKFSEIAATTTTSLAKFQGEIKRSCCSILHRTLDLRTTVFHFLSWYKNVAQYPCDTLVKSSIRIQHNAQHIYFAIIVFRVRYHIFQ